MFHQVVGHEVNILEVYLKDSYHCILPHSLFKYFESDLHVLEVLD